MRLDTFVLILKYTFAVALAAEGLIIARALVRLAREKAQPIAAAASEE